jgi:hypothetical protein
MTSLELRRHLAEHHYADSPPFANMNEAVLLQLLKAVHETAPKQGSHPDE